MLSASREFQIMKVARPSMEFFSLLRLILFANYFLLAFHYPAGNMRIHRSPCETRNSISSFG